MAHKPIEKFGVQAEKARVITVYRNGDRHHDGAQITLNMKKFKTYDQARNAEGSRGLTRHSSRLRCPRW